MVRVINRKTPLTPKERAERAKKYRVTRSFVWIDPFPQIQGTKPEKMIYAELVKRGIPFEYQTYLKITGIDLETDPWYRPDFMLPAEKIIIEANGAYWHTKTAQINADAFKYALYQMMGWRVIIWWDYEIEDHLQELFNREPVLAYRSKPLTVLPQNVAKKDDSAGIAKLNLKKRKPWTKPSVGIKVKKRRKSRSRGK
jgi:G:T-mismatch repair DNA endonuclease (very short patch repair protein)